MLSMDSVNSSDDDLAEFLAGLRQRYNLDAPAAAETTTEETAAATPQGPDRPGISTDAAILGLHPAFRGSITHSPASLRSGQLTTAEAETGGDGALPRAAAQAQYGAALPSPTSPGATSESGSCLTPQPAGLMSASQLAGAEAPVAVSPTDAAAAGSGAPTAIEAPAGAAGAVAAAATPHSTAAMPAAWCRAQHSPPGPLQDSLMHEGRGRLQQAEQADASHTAFELRATTTTAAGAAAAAGSRQGLEGDAARQEGSMEDFGSSVSSSPSSIAKPLLAAFTAAAKQAAEQQVLSQQPQRHLLQQQQHEVQQQQDRQQQQEASGSEVTLQSMLDSPRRRRQQSPQQQRSPSILQPGSPPRPLLGVWATRAATAAVSEDTPAPAGLAPIRVTDPTAAAAAAATANTAADTQPAGSAAAADARALPPAVAAAATARDPADVQLTSAAANTPPAAPQQLSDVRAVGGSSDHVTALPSPPGTQPAAPSQAAEDGPDKRSQTASSPAVVPVDAGAAAQVASDSALSPEPQQQQQQQPELPQSVQLQRGPAQSAGAAVDWARLSDQLSAAGFGHLALVQECDGAGLAEQQLAEQQASLLPALPGLYDSFCRVLHEYQRRDGLMQQLLSERDEMRRASRRSNTESSKLERERDEAMRSAARLKAELADVRTVEVPALESKHREALARLNSEVARLKHALKEAEAAAAAAQAEVAAASTQTTLQAQLHDAVRERERLRVEVERLESELSRQKSVMKELDRASALARAGSRHSANQAVVLDKQLRQLRQQHQEELAAATAELNKARHAAREAEQQLLAVRAEAAAGSSGEPELQRELATERAQHAEQQAHLASELQALRQQLLQLQQAAAKAEAAAKADSNAAVHASKQLALQEKQHRAEVAKLSGEVKQARESLQLLQAKLLQAEAEAAEQSAAATGAEAAALESSDRAAAAVAELDKLRNSNLQQQQQLLEQLQEGKRSLAECQQQLVSTQAELRRLRAAAALADATAVPPAYAGVDTLTLAEHAAVSAEGSASSGLGLEPAGSARVLVSGTGGSSARPSKAAAAAAAGSDADLAGALSRAVAAEAAAAEVESSLVGLRYKCMQLEMTCSRKEQELEALRDRLAQKVTREERRLARDKAVYQRIKQAYAATGGSAAGRRAALAAAGGTTAWSAAVDMGPGAASSARRSNAAGAVAAAARELRPVELVGIYEGQKEALEKELAAAKAEVRVLSAQLRDAQNLLISRDRAASVAAAAAGVKGIGLPGRLGDPATIAAAQKKAAEMQRELCTVRAEAASALREAAKRLAESEAEVSQLRGDVIALQEELDGRPTQAEQRRLQREVDLLQRKISALRRQAAADQPGGSAASGEDALAAAVAAGDIWGADDRALGLAGGSSRSRGTKTAIERDKALARLGLGVVEEFPRDVLVDIVQDMCIVLELRDATLLVASLKKVAAVASAIPSVEAFVAQVCEVVLREGLAFIPAAAQDTGLSPKCVPQVLQHWLTLLRQGELFAQSAEQLQQLVAQRCCPAPQAPEIAAGAAAGGCDAGGVQQLCRQLLLQVQDLLQVEAEAVAAADVVLAAKGLLVTQPDGLLQRLVLQVMELLGVEKLVGVPAAVNRVYVHYTELLNFLKAVISLLALPADAGPAAAMAALAQLVEQAARPPSKVRQAAAELRAAANMQQPQQQQQLDMTEALEGDATAAGDRLAGLLAALGAVDEQQAADRHREMVLRLRRLDQVLPKYQSIVSQLYDRLRVVSLDELVPAVDRLMRQQLTA